MVHGPQLFRGDVAAQERFLVRDKSTLVVPYILRYLLAAAAGVHHNLSEGKGACPFGWQDIHPCSVRIRYKHRRQGAAHDLGA